MISVPSQREQLAPTAPLVSEVPVKPKWSRRIEQAVGERVERAVAVDVEGGERRRREALREHAVAVAVLGILVSPGDHEVAVAVGVDRAAELTVRGVGVHLELGAEGAVRGADAAREDARG